MAAIIAAKSSFRSRTFSTPTPDFNSCSRIAGYSVQTIQSGNKGPQLFVCASAGQRRCGSVPKVKLQGGSPVLLRGIATVVFSLTAMNCSAQSDSSRAADIDKYLQPYIRSNNFSGAVLASQDGKVIFKRAYGFANREKRIRNTAETQFHIASVSMQFTAAAVLRLIDSGSIRLNESVGTLRSGSRGRRQNYGSRPSYAALRTTGYQWSS